MPLKLLLNFRSRRTGQYRGWNSPSEPGFENREIILFRLKLLASSFDPRACGEIAASAVKAGIAPISPFMPLKTPARMAEAHRTVTSINATKLQQSKNLGMRVSNR
jgi:hypothetical protein